MDAAVTDVHPVHDRMYRRAALDDPPAHDPNVVGAGISDNNPDPLAVATERKAATGRFPVFSDLAAHPFYSPAARRWLPCAP